MPFQLNAPYQPTGDQPRAIEELVAGYKKKKQHQTLLGVTGSGKTYTVANVIQTVQKPTLVLAHNKTLAAQLYQEFRDFFPNNAVSYFVSYYDYYQPEAYIPSTDTYIEKEATINDEIDKLRLAATTNLLTRPDTIVVSSVSAIYNLGSPVEYGKYVLQLVEGEIISRETLFLQLSSLQYDRSDNEFRRGSFRIRGDILQVWPAYEDRALRIDTLENKITSIKWIDPISGMVLDQQESGNEHHPHRYVIYPAKHYVMNPKSQQESFAQIRTDLQQRLDQMEQQGKKLEAYRLQQKVNYDLEMMQEFGFVGGIENYSRYFDGRQAGDPPYTLLEYFAHNAREFGDGTFLTVVDESHISLPQIKGMYFGDQSRKQTLIDFGFRLPSALDNRPLKFEEFMSKTNDMLYVSATPDKYELSLSGGEAVEQLIRPTFLVDPNVELRPTQNQIEDLVVEIINRKALGQRTLVTTLTKKMAEALTDYLNNTHKIDELLAHYAHTAEARAEADLSEEVIWSDETLPIETMEIGKVDPKYLTHATLTAPTTKEFYPKVAYLHSDIETLERSDILDDLRRGVYDVVVGINLLREGLDLPEVTLVAILDADKEGFLRSRTSLIQTMGRGARHVAGHSILYADNLTGSMKAAMSETLRRRAIQIAYNKQHGITPQTIAKPIRDRMIEKKEEEEGGATPYSTNKRSKTAKKDIIIALNKSEQLNLSAIDPQALTPKDKSVLTTKLKRRMLQAAKDMDFELAALIRDKLASF